MEDNGSLCHTKWECKYHVVFIPKHRRKTLFGQLRKHLGEVFRELARQRESVVVEGHLLADHVHMLISIPPKYSVSQVIGFIKGKSAIHIARVYCGRKKISQGKVFGREVILYQQSIEMKWLSGSTFNSKSRKINGSTSCNCYEAAAYWRLMVFNRFERFKRLQATGFAGGS